MVESIEHKIRENHLKWFVYVYRISEQVVVRISNSAQTTLKEKRKTKEDLVRDN